MKTSLIVSIFIVSAAGDQICNGYAELCNRSYGNVTFIGAHDSAFYSQSEVVISADQHNDVTQQLNDGIRLLQSQGHKAVLSNSDNIELCHTSCAVYEGGALTSYLLKVKTWLDANPYEVLTILFTNPDGINVTTWANDFATTGIADMAYIPPFNSTPADSSSWPTLGSMITSGKRVVIFLDAHANSSQVPYILDEFSYMWETPFDETNTSFPCVVDRPHQLRNTVPTGRLSLVNHFLDKQLPNNILVPDRASLENTNAVSGIGSLGNQAETCAGIYGRWPNFMLVDFYDVGNGSVFQVAAKANGVTLKAFHSAGSRIKVSLGVAILSAVLFVLFRQEWILL